MINMKSIEREVLQGFAEILKQRSTLDPTFLDNELIDDLVAEMKESLDQRNDLFAMLKLESTINKPIVESLKIENANQSQSLDAQKKGQEKDVQKTPFDVNQPGRQSEGDSKQVTEEKKLIAKQNNEEKDQNTQNVQLMKKTQVQQTQVDHKSNSLKKQKQQREKIIKQLKLKLEQQWQKQYQAECDLTEKARQMAKKGATVHISGIYNQKTKRFDKKKDIQHLSLHSVIIKTQKDEFLINKMKGVFARGNKEKIMQIGQSQLEKEEQRQISKEQKMLLLNEMTHY